MKGNCLVNTFIYTENVVYYISHKYQKQFTITPNMMKMFPPDTHPHAQSQIRKKLRNDKK